MKQIYTEPACIIDGSRGVYIPQLFALWFLQNGWTVSDNLWINADKDSLLSGPDAGDNYWEAWDELLSHPEIGPDGVVYEIHQDSGGDLFLIPPGYEWSDGADWFVKVEGVQC